MVEQEAKTFGARTTCAQCGAPFTAVVTGQTTCDRCQGLANPEPPSAPNAEIAGFRLHHELGAGRFSRSWLGEDERSHAVVVKLLRRYAPDPEAVDRFVAEAERLARGARPDHPGPAPPGSPRGRPGHGFFLVV